MFMMPMMVAVCLSDGQHHHGEPAGSPGDDDDDHEAPLAAATQDVLEMMTAGWRYVRPESLYNSPLGERASHPATPPATTTNLGALPEFGEPSSGPGSERASELPRGPCLLGLAGDEPARPLASY